MSILSSRKIFSSAVQAKPKANLNLVHEEAYRIMLGIIQKYYEGKVDRFLLGINLSSNIRTRLRERILRPVKVGDKDYSNFMEEAARRLSQSKQITSGNIAEYCVQLELERKGLQKGRNFTVKKGQGADIIMYHPNKDREKKRHRVEVKNVKMRERAARGFSYDGDSMIGFFNSKGEFGEGAVTEIEQLCRQKDGYCYVPPEIIEFLDKQGKLRQQTRIKPNTSFGEDMTKFCKTGKLQ